MSYSYSRERELSPYQRRIWTSYKFNKDNVSFNLGYAYHFKGKIDPEILRGSISEVFERHYCVFSRFIEHKQSVVISILPEEIKLSTIDLSGQPYEEALKNSKKYSSEDRRKPFNLEKGPLFRLLLIKLAEEEYLFHATFHHIIFDGWSRKIFFEELGQVYKASVAGQKAKLSGLEVECTNARDSELSEKESSAYKKFWKNYLEGVNAELKFPFNESRKAIIDGIGESEVISLGSDIYNKLNIIARENHISIFRLVLSSLAIVFHKYSNDKDFCIGTFVANRKKKGTENIFGMFVDTVPVRFNFDNDYNYLEFVRRNSENIKEAIAHRAFPFEKIIETVNPDRNILVNPLFQVSLSWLEDFVQPVNLNGAIGEPVFLEEGISPFDISFHLWESNNDIKGEILYNSSILSRETIVRLKDSLKVLLQEALNNPEKLIKNIPVISPEELRKIEKINATQRFYPKDKSIVRLFEEAAKRFPEKQALVYRGMHLSYSELDRRSSGLAHTLRASGVIRETPVAILTDKSLEMVVGILAILKAGGAYVPVDPEYPASRVDFILKDANCKIILTHHKYVSRDFGPLKVMDLNKEDNYLFDDERPLPEGRSEDLAAIIFTSGTTGVPKGSLIRQFSIIRLIYDPNYMELHANDRLLYTSSIVFDVTSFELWSMLLNGGTLYIADKEVILDAEAIGQELKENQITILHLTSALFTELCEKKPEIFSDLNYLLVGGDVLSPQHIMKVRHLYPELKVINCYGPSENTTYSTTFLIEEDYERNIPVGKPVSNSTAYIFDKEMNTVPFGVMGELFVGGDGLSRGYLNREDLNSTKFLQHPLTGERLYRTGDLARWLEDGNIEFHGRTDNQIKIRGFRIELEEIESIINEMNGVVESVVKPIKYNERDIRLVAFIKTDNSCSIESAEINLNLKNRLPSYMVPSAYRIVESFKRTINGKIDKSLLTFDFSEIVSSGRDLLQDLSDAEKRLLKIWEDFLKVNDIGIQDNFFDIGGHSLLAISIVEKIEQEFGLKLPLRVFFDSPTIYNLGQIIDIMKNKDSSDKRTEDNMNIIAGEI